MAERELCGTLFASSDVTWSVLVVSEDLGVKNENNLGLLFFNLMTCG